MQYSLCTVYRRDSIWYAFSLLQGEVTYGFLTFYSRMQSVKENNLTVVLKSVHYTVPITAVAIFKWAKPCSKYLSCNISSKIASPSYYSNKAHCVKSVQIRSYFWSVFSCIRTRNNSVFGHFLRSGKLDICNIKLRQANFPLLYSL